MIVLTDALGDAVIAARRYHAGQIRKGTAIPYVSHLLAVASLVLEAGGDETQAVAALLHDAAEDAGGRTTLDEISARFGSEVARIVAACSDVIADDPAAPKPPWLEREERYIAHLRSADASTMLVSAADKLHNLRSIAADYGRIGDAIWQRFSAPGDKRASTLWYYRSLYEVYRAARWPETLQPQTLLVPLGALLDAFGAEDVSGSPGFHARP